MKYPLYKGQEVIMDKCIPYNDYAIINGSFQAELKLWGVTLLGNIVPNIFAAIGTVTPLSLKNKIYVLGDIK